MTVLIFQRSSVVLRSACLASNHRLSPLWVRVPQVAKLRTCPSMTLTIKLDVKSQLWLCFNLNIPVNLRTPVAFWYIDFGKLLIASEYLIYSLFSTGKQRLNIPCLHRKQVHFKHSKGLRNLPVVLCWFTLTEFWRLHIFGALPQHCKSFLCFYLRACRLQIQL